MTYYCYFIKNHNVLNGFVNTLQNQYHMTFTKYVNYIAEELCIWLCQINKVYKEFLIHFTLTNLFSLNNFFLEKTLKCWSKIKLE